MGMNETPSANRVHIGIFGRRNAGKSSLINAVTGQSLAIVSDRKGTTTDPVSKAMELLPLGPVVLIDTPGLDDEGELGEQRIAKTYQVLNKVDMAVLVTEAETVGTDAFEEVERPLLRLFAEKKLPYVIAVNKAELLCTPQREAAESFFQKEAHLLFVSAKTGQNIQKLKECLAVLMPAENMTGRLVGDLLRPHDTVVLVVPIDSAAPKGRLILPQQQVIRDCLEAGAISVVVRDTELGAALGALKEPPRLVITDSQAFGRVSREVPRELYLTSFSILFARYKGDLRQQADGARAIRTLRDGDTVLISEGCTHHRQCEDIGTVKLPRMLRAAAGKELLFSFTSGGQFPEDLSPYALVVHCGGCTLNEREMKRRLSCAKEQRVPMTNYGVALAAMHGILERSLEIFGNPQEGL